MARVITHLQKKIDSNTWDNVPIGVKTEYVFGESGNLKEILKSIETRLKNIEACLREVAQDTQVSFTDEEKNPTNNENNDI
jgi:hypothetical protein